MQLVLDTESDNAALRGQVSQLNAQVADLSKKIDYMIEQIRLANAQRFGRHTEKLDEIAGQIRLFNECETLYQEGAREPAIGDVIPQKPKKKKQKGRRKLDLSELPHQPFAHTIDHRKLDEFYGEGNWKQMPTEEYMRLRFQPASWLVEDHTVEVYVGTDGDHQDEFMRAEHPKSLIRNSIATPSLEAAVMNAKYVNAMPLYRIEQEFNRNGICISRQTMANWTILCSERYLSLVWDRLREHLLKYHVLQADETPLVVINNGEEGRSKCYMWVYRSGEFYRDRPIVLYEFQTSRHHKHPEAFFKDFKGILKTDGLNQYHMLEKLIEGLTSANCWAHACRDYADAIKAGDKKHPDDPRLTIAYQALVRIAAIYKLEESLKDLTSEERLRRRQESIKPLVDEYFAWIKDIQSQGILLKGSAFDGIRYSINHEKYLRVFLTDGDVPIDNSASERSIRTFCVGEKNWTFSDSVKGAQASAVIYSITETAKLNDLNPYYYIEHLLERMPYIVDLKLDKEDMDAELDKLLPWSKELPAQCYKKRR